MTDGMIGPGDRAPDFELPAADGEGTVSLSLWRRRGPVLVALFRGLYCPFSRRQMVQLGLLADRLRLLGVEPLGVVATAPERARPYFAHHPPCFRFGADPGLVTHHAYRLPALPRDAEGVRMVEAAAQRVAREIGLAAEPGHGRDTIDRADGFVSQPSDREDRERHQIQLIGQFLVDRDGMVRWSSTEAIAGYAVFPLERDLVAAAEALRR